MTSEESLQDWFQNRKKLNNYVYIVVLVTNEASQTFLGRDRKQVARCEIQFTQHQPYNEKREHWFAVPLARNRPQQPRLNFPSLLLRKWNGSEEKKSVICGYELTFQIPKSTFLKFELCIKLLHIEYRRMHTKYIHHILSTDCKTISMGITTVLYLHVPCSQNIFIFYIKTQLLKTGAVCFLRPQSFWRQLTWFCSKHLILITTQSLWLCPSNRLLQTRNNHAVAICNLSAFKVSFFLTVTNFPENKFDTVNVPCNCITHKISSSN
jgi:hypothetical protein